MKLLPKCSRPKNEGVFRPISILWAPSKILEAVAYKQLDDFIAANDLLDPLQSGFRSYHSAHTALIDIVHGLRKGVDKSVVTLLVAIDFDRAFDLVKISLLTD